MRQYIPHDTGGIFFVFFRFFIVRVIIPAAVFLIVAGTVIAAVFTGAPILLFILVFLFIAGRLEGDTVYFPVSPFPGDTAPGSVVF